MATSQRPPTELRRLPSWLAVAPSLAEIGACLTDAVPLAESAAVVILTAERSPTPAENKMLDGAEVVCTSPAAAALIDVEGQFDEGPILTACRSRSIVASGALGANARWRRFGPAMADRQLHSVICVPLRSNKGVAAGALAVYSRHHNAFDAGAISLIAALADVVANTLCDAQRLEATARAFTALREAHQRSRIVDQAVGVLISQHNCTEEQARSRLSRMANQGYEELSTSARLIVDEARREAHLNFIARDHHHRQLH